MQLPTWILTYSFKPAEKHFPAPTNTISSSVNQSSGKLAARWEKTSFLLNPRRHTSPLAASSFPFQSSQGRRGWTYLFYSLQSSPPFPPGSYEIVCRLCYLCKTGPRREILLPGTVGLFLPGVCFKCGSLQKVLQVDARFPEPSQLNSSLKKKKLIFKIFKRKPRKIRAWISNYKVISNMLISEYFYRRRLLQKVELLQIRWAP